VTDDRLTQALADLAESAINGGQPEPSAAPTSTANDTP